MPYGVHRQFLFREVEYTLRSIKCGKENCSKCPHGPYWYARVTIPFKPAVTRYIGKELRGAVLQHAKENGHV